MNEEIRNAVWQWFYDRGLDPRRAENREMFEKAREAILEKFEGSDDEGDEGGSLQQVLIAKDMPVSAVIRSALDSTMDKEVKTFVENIRLFNLFDEVDFKPKKQEKEQNEELDDENDLSDLEM